MALMLGLAGGASAAPPPADLAALTGGIAVPMATNGSDLQLAAISFEFGDDWDDADDDFDEEEDDEDDEEDDEDEWDDGVEFEIEI